MKNIFLVFLLFFSINLVSQTNDKIKKDSIYTYMSVDKNFNFDSCKDVEQGPKDLLFGCFNRELKNFINKELTSEMKKGDGCYSGRYSIYLSFVVNENGRFEDVSLRFRGNNTCNDLTKAIRNILKNNPKIIPAIKNGENVKEEFKTMLMYRF
ncbi:hypothetical protein [Polaribacter uvawellassae]|uniref:hypothetical protein n=1 Tax=Polaribacter uvawellassae TaxID=3133495 RepID=UPI00321992CA